MTCMALEFLYRWGLKTAITLRLYEGQSPRVTAFNRMRKVGERDSGVLTPPKHALPPLITTPDLTLGDGMHIPGLSCSAPAPHMRRSKLVQWCSESIHAGATLLRMSNVWSHDWASTETTRSLRPEQAAPEPWQWSFTIRGSVSWK